MLQMYYLVKNVIDVLLVMRGDLVKNVIDVLLVKNVTDVLFSKECYRCTISNER